MHHPTDRTADTPVFGGPVVNHWYVTMPPIRQIPTSFYILYLCTMQYLSYIYVVVPVRFPAVPNMIPSVIPQSSKDAVE